jgi:hypothetical protein
LEGEHVPNVEERLALLEGRVQEQAVHMMDLRGINADLRHELRGLRDEMIRRFEHVDRRFDWLIGILVTGFIAVIGTVAGAFWGLLQVVRSATP